MKDFIKKYLLVSKPHSKEASTGCAGGGKNSRQPAFEFQKEHSASKIHCKIIVQDGNKLLLTELNNNDAAFVNGKKIPAKTPLSIAGGDEIEFRKAGVKIRFELDQNLQTQEKAALLGAHEALKESNTDAGIVLSDLVIDPALNSLAATYGEMKRPGIGKTFERSAPHTDVKSRETLADSTAGIKGASGGFFLNRVFSPYYAGMFFMVLGLVLGGVYFWTQLNSVPERFESEAVKINNPVALVKEEIKEYDSLNTILPVAESKPETVELTKENQPAIDKNLLPPAPDAKQLVSNSQALDIVKPTIKKRLAVKNKKKIKHKASSESSDPHIDAWAKEFFTH